MFDLGKYLVQTAADSTVLILYGAILNELQQYDAAHKASDENKLFDRGRVYFPTDVTAASLGEGVNRVISSFVSILFFPLPCI